MSGGAAVKAAGGGRGVTRAARNEVGEDRGYAPPAPSKGLGLDGAGAASPLFNKPRATPAGAGRPLVPWQNSSRRLGKGFARGIVTAGPRRHLKRLGEPPQPFAQARVE